MQKYQFEITNINIEINIDKKIKITKPYKPFLKSENSIPDIQLFYKGMNDLSFTECRKSSLESIEIRDSFFNYDSTSESVNYDFFTKYGITAYAKWNYKKQTLNTIYFNKKIPDLFYDFRSVFEIMNIETLLLQNNSLILHSSFISDGCNGILFSAPSGTGKSTQAELWRQNSNFEIINGDRSGLRKIDETWKAYGLPYAGSSEIYKNESVPIRAIFLLEQSRENKIEPLNHKDMLIRLLPEVTIHRWNPYLTDIALNLLSDLIGNVPVLLLKCSPDIDAVNVVRKYLVENNLYNREEADGNN